MKLTFKDPFSLEIPLTDGQEDIITGTVRQLNKKEIKEIDAGFEEIKKKAKYLEKKTKVFEKKSKKLIRIEKKIEHFKDLTIEKVEAEYLLIEAFETELDAIEAQMEPLIEELDNSTHIIDTQRKRFDLTIVSERKSDLKKICEDIGYEKVFKVISEDIEAKKPKD